jgi:peptide subunit release factor RF-3
MAEDKKRSVANGCYAITAPNGVVYLESSEIRALRKAVAVGGTNEFVKWGSAVGDAGVAEFTDEPAQAEPKPRAKKAEPKDTPAVQPEPKGSPVDSNAPDNF